MSPLVRAHLTLLACVSALTTLVLLCARRSSTDTFEPSPNSSGIALRRSVALVVGDDPRNGSQRVMGTVAPIPLTSNPARAQDPLAPQTAPPIRASVAPGPKQAQPDENVPVWEERMMMQASANVPSQEDRAVMPGGKLSRFSAAISSEQATRQHRIVEGESLESIAERHLGSATRASEIFQWNRDRLQQPDLLPLGIYLRIPPRWSEVATTQGGPETLPPDWAPVPPAIGSTPK